MPSSEMTGVWSLGDRVAGNETGEESDLNHKTLWILSSESRSKGEEVDTFYLGKRNIGKIRAFILFCWLLFFASYDKVLLSNL